MTVNTNHNVQYAPADFRPALWERWVALRNGCFTQVEEIISPVLALHVPGGPIRPVPAGGRRSLVCWLSAVRATVPPGRFVVQVGPIINGDLIAGRWALAADDGLPGGTGAYTGTDILRVADGQVLELWINHDAPDRVPHAERVAA